MGNVIMKAQQIAYGASNVEKALDDLNVPELIELNKRMDAIDAWKANVHEGTYTGSELTINNALALPARSLITSINAIQDLHGYDHPWVGGAYKNKLPMTVSAIKAANTTGTWTGNVYAINNGTIEILTDSAGNVIGFKVNGTFSAGTSFNIISGLTLPQVDYIMSGSADFNNDFFIAVQTSGGNVIATATDVTITNTITDALCWIRIGANVTVSNKTIKPMIRLSTESDASFAPYSNICPISGRTEAVVDDLPKADYVPFFEGVKNGTYGFVDLGSLSWTYYTGASTPMFFASIADGKATPTTAPANILCGKYTKASNSSMDAATFASYGYGYYAQNKANVCQILISDSAYTDAVAFKTAMSGVYLIYELATPTTPSYTAEQWAALVNSFGGNNVTIQLGTTVYGADINWDTGVMTVKTAKVDISTLDIKQFPNTSVFYASVEDGSNDNVPPTSITSCYKLNTTSGVTGVADGEFQYGKPVVVTGNRAFNCRDDRYNTVADFKAGIAGQDLEYPLATPTTLQLTPTELQMLKGYNRITVASGYATIELKALVLGGDN